MEASIPASTGQTMLGPRDHMTPTGTVAEPETVVGGGWPSDGLDGDVAGVRGESFQIGRVTGQHRAARFSERHNDRVDSRTGPGSAPEFRSPT